MNIPHVKHITKSIKGINVQELRKSEHFNKIASATAALAIVIIGSIFLLITHAATTQTAVEPEQGTRSGNATVVTDSSASGGKSLAFNAPVPPPPSGALCGWRTTPPSTYKHVVWIIMENHTYSAVIGQSTAPYLTNLATKSCASDTNWSDQFASSIPSLPHYIAMTSGSNQGITDDYPPSKHPNITVDNIFRQVRTAGLTEKQYMEDMPSNCDQTGSSPYAVRHNAPAYYVGGTDHQACLKDNVPMGSATTGNLGNDIKNDALPNFAILVPNVCHQTHGPCNTTPQLQQGDDFLKTLVVALTGSQTYQNGDMAIFVVYDENTSIPNAVIAPTVKPGFVTNSPVGHYSFLRTTEEMLGIKSYLGGANNAPSMRSLFNL